ncbi:MAG TPA: dephospho-CoA kinase [Chitinophagaceae bacterium]|jgi:dephospho-CoA kinase|nr:dephospho-CoA kinase [Chitinophagaceae bacterium]HMU57871.1 dephospho-CoA kinase [Chitinophagaceae bacterium]
MLLIGLTGGIGSGKSTVAKVFETLGIPVYYADDAAKRLMNTNPSLKQEIVRHFGTESYKDGILNRAYIASIVFGNKEKLNQLNSLVHPATIEDSQQWVNQQTAPYIIREAALLFESGASKGLDYVIGVSAPLLLRIQRVMQRDGLSKGEIEQRISRQMDEEEKMRLCDFVINNDEQTLIITQILELDKKLRALKKPA